MTARAPRCHARPPARPPARLRSPSTGYRPTRTPRPASPLPACRAVPQPPPLLSSGPLHSARKALKIRDKRSRAPHSFLLCGRDHDSTHAMQPVWELDEPPRRAYAAGVGWMVAAAGDQHAAARVARVRSSDSVHHSPYRFRVSKAKGAIRTLHLGFVRTVRF